MLFRLPTGKKMYISYISWYPKGLRVNWATEGETSLFLVGTKYLGKNQKWEKVPSMKTARERGGVPNFFKKPLQKRALTEGQKRHGT